MMENTAILAPNETVYLTTEGNLATPAEGLRGRLRRYLEAKPTVWMMNLLTFVTGIFLCVAIFLGILAGFSLLRWIGGLVLLYLTSPPPSSLLFYPPVFFPAPLTRRRHTHRGRTPRGAGSAA